MTPNRCYAVGSSRLDDNAFACHTVAMTQVIILVVGSRMGKTV
jgi:hypothetical protein